MKVMVIEILFFSGCPHHEPTLNLTNEVLGELGLDVEIRVIPVESADEAVRHRFVGSPSVRVDGKDIELDAHERTDFGLSCRIYAGGGVPPRELLVEALREASQQR